MNDAFNANFKNLLLFIGTAASKTKGCPMDKEMVGILVRFMFDDTARASKLKDKFKENRALICEKYGASLSLESLIKAQDRTLFNHIDLFPDWVHKTYPKHIAWFSTFLANGLEDKYMKFVWGYLEAMNRQA